MEYYAAIRRNELALYLLTWRDIHDVLAREISKEQYAVHKQRSTRVKANRKPSLRLLQMSLYGWKSLEKGVRGSWWAVSHGQWAVGTAWGLQEERGMS